jgi:tripartite-type tricarboxylate transporter receptor subunit TctC
MAVLLEGEVAVVRRFARGQSGCSPVSMRLPAVLSRGFRRPPALLVACLLAAPAMVFAQPWPTKPIRFVSGFPPGGTVDILCRALGVKMTESWGQPVVVENRSGAAGSLASEYVAKAPPDGYTLLLGTTATQSIAPLVYSKIAYGDRDFTPVTTVATVPLILIVHPSLPVRSVQEFIAFARARPEQLNYASTGTGAVPHLATEMLSRRAGLKMTHVPYKGAALAMSDLVSGQVSLMMDNAPTALPLVRSGRLRAIAVASEQRIAQAPELPTLAEGGLPGFAVENWFGVLGPAGLPRDVVAKVNAEVHRIVAAPDVRDRLVQQGMALAVSTPDAYAARIRADTAKWGAIVKATGVRID